MEVSLSEYGRMMFEMMCGKKNNMPDHWASIAAEATPLVMQLIALNEKMVVDGKAGGYEVIGAPDKTGKKKLSKRRRIELAQEKDLLTTAGSLKVGDHFWLHKHYDHEMYVGEHEPVRADDITAKGIYFDMPHCGGSHMERIGPNDKVLKAPGCFGDWPAPTAFSNKEITEDEYREQARARYAEQERFTSDEYWLKRAEELGL